jgi:hypothetical protein
MSRSLNEGGSNLPDVVSSVFNAMLELDSVSVDGISSLVGSTSSHLLKETNRRNARERASHVSPHPSFSDHCSPINISIIVMFIVLVVVVDLAEEVNLSAE